MDIHGKLALFGESVLFKKIVKFKGNNIFERGVWAGKHPWNDTHVILTPEGAFEVQNDQEIGSWGELHCNGHCFFFSRGFHGVILLKAF